MEVIHKNDLSAYLSGWREKIEMMNKLSKIGKYKPHPFPKTFQAIFIQTIDLSVVLRYLDLKLRILENTKSPLAMNYQAYTDSVVFLKAAYLFYRILLDTLAGVIEYFYKKNERINLPHSFNKLLIREKEGKLPKDLSDVLKNTHIWFPEFKERRDDLSHHYESFLILFGKDKSSVNILEHSNRPIKKELKNYGVIREYLGFLLCGYQQLVDDLLDHFDTKFKDWYGIIASRSSRIQTTRVGNCASILWWWAYKYGGYKHPDLIFTK